MHACKFCQKLEEENLSYNVNIIHLWFGIMLQMNVLKTKIIIWQKILRFNVVPSMILTKPLDERIVFRLDSYTANMIYTSITSNFFRSFFALDLDSKAQQIGFSANTRYLNSQSSDCIGFIFGRAWILSLILFDDICL